MVHGRSRKRLNTLTLGVLAATSRGFRYDTAAASPTQGQNVLPAPGTSVDPAVHMNSLGGSSKCPLDISVLWTADVDSPVYSTPIVMRASDDGRKQIVLATVGGVVELLEGDGSVPDPWPLALDSAVFHASPSVDSINGVQAFCVSDSRGSFTWFMPGGDLPCHFAAKILLRNRDMERDWYEGLDVNDVGAEGQFVTGSAVKGKREETPLLQDDGHPLLDEAESGVKTFDDDGFGDYSSIYGDNKRDEALERSRRFVGVTGHLLAAPVFVDINGDGVKEMIAAVSYFIDPNQASRSALEETPNPEKYAAASLICWEEDEDHTPATILWERYLGQSMADGEKAAYVYASPTVADLDGDGALEVMVGSALGYLHVMDAKTGTTREGFPWSSIHEGRIEAQVAVADVDGDHELEMLVGDTAGMLYCVKEDGTECWKPAVLSGPITSTVSLGDVDGDGSLDVVVGVSTAEGSGEVWAVSAESGLQLPYFPVKFMNRKGVSAAITLVDLHPDTAGKTGTGGAPAEGLHLLAPSEDGHVYVIQGATGCVSKIDVGERVMSMVLADDLNGDGVLDLLVGTMSGELVALSANVPFHPLNAWTSPVRGHVNVLAHGDYQGVYFMGKPSDFENVVGRQFSVSFEIVDKSGHAKSSSGENGNSMPYQVTISAEREILFKETFQRPGIKTATLSLNSPRKVLLHVQMVNRQYLVFEDYVGVGYNTWFHSALKWTVVGPLVLAFLPLLWGQLRARRALPA